MSQPQNGGRGCPVCFKVGAECRCGADFVVEGLADGSIESATAVSNGAPCKCGPGFCASEVGVGYYGYCGGSGTEAAPDCPICGAPHQSPAGCWLCSTRGGNNPENANLWLRALRLGVDGNALFRWQDEARRRTGKWVSLDEILDEYEALG